jgi:cysteine-rich repeat protein
MTTRLLAPILVLFLASSALAVCGDGTIDAGEDCDDANTTSGDGCSAACLFEGCPLTGTWHSSVPLDIDWTFVEAGDGTISGKSWPTGVTNPRFVTLLTGTRTGSAVSIDGSGTIYTGTMHECDALTISSNSSTLDLSRIRSTYCGDGTIDAPYENCDPLDPGNGPGGCDIDCFSICGDGMLEGLEQCDDANHVDGDGCSGTCQTNVCGNGTIESGEQCDDGNTTNGDGCSFHCQVTVCGNGVIEDGEECDDGNVVSGDGCSALCAFDGCPLTGTWRITYPFDITWTFAEAGDGTLSGVEYMTSSPNTANALTGSRTGKSVSVSFGGQDFVGTMDDCDSLPLLFAPYYFYLHRERTTYCGDGTTQAPDEVCDDGNFVNGDGCTVACAAAVCGNAIVEVSEQCDDGNLTNGDGCSATCQTNVCGNGTIESGEQCDDSNTVNGDGCSAHCQTNVCGNSVIEDGEECDDGNASNGDGCSALCAFEGCPLTGTWQSTSSFRGGDLTWTFVEAADGTLSGVNFFTGAGANTHPVTGFRSGRSISVVDGPFLFTGTMDGCDDFALTMPPLELQFTRTRSTYCGDGIQQAAFEVCDDGNLDNGDTCTAGCAAPSGCGNGLLDSPEECDDANGNNTDVCVTGCLFNVCGDGFVNVGEEACDDGNTTSGDGCAADCLSLEEESAGGAVGGSTLTITTDTEADGATPSDPVETTLSAPPGTISGTLAIVEQTAPPVAPAGFVFMGTLVTVTATDIVPAPTATTPLTLSFQIDASVIPAGQSASSIEIRKDGAAVAACTGAAGVASPDPCVATRTTLPDGDVGLTILTTTLSDWAFSGSVCGAGPLLGCQSALSKKAKLKIKAGDREFVAWSWKSSAETPLSIFGDPGSTNDYTLCLYGSGGLRMQLTAPAGSTCKDGKPCWALGSKGFKYADRSAAHDGVTKVVLKPGVAGKAKLGLVAKGQLDLATLPLTLPVSVQLRAKDGACFQAAFGAAKRNDAVKFQATNE